MKKEFKGAGKGKGPIVGYNSKNWYSNFDNIDFHNLWCAFCGKMTNHRSGYHFPKSGSVN